MPKRGGKRKKTRTHKDDIPEGATTMGEDGPRALREDVPRSIVAKASKVIPIVSELVLDMRRVMSPYTAMKLREKKDNRMKDYAAVASQLGVTHLVIFSQTKTSVVLRIGRTGTGPTLHFKVPEYSLARQVRLLQKRPYESAAAFMTSPLVVLNNFGSSDESQVKLMRITFQNMFPSINIKTIKLTDCRRVVLFNYRKEDGCVEMRHYAIRAAPVGINRSVKKILHSQIPNLGKLEDISEYINGQSGYPMSDSEGEEDEASKVVLPDRFSGKGNARMQQSAMKLTELGPRITLDIFKVEQGVCDGEVIYHKYESKTPAEAAALKSRIEKQRLLKLERRAIQEENVKRKKAVQAEKVQAKLEKKRRRTEGGEEGKGNADDEDDDDDDDGDEDEGNEGGDEDDDELDDDDNDEFDDDDDDDDGDDDEEA